MLEKNRAVELDTFMPQLADDHGKVGSGAGQPIMVKPKMEISCAQIKEHFQLWEKKNRCVY